MILIQFKQGKRDTVSNKFLLFYLSHVTENKDYIFQLQTLKYAIYF